MFYLTQSQNTDTKLTSPSADPIMPDIWQGSLWSAWYDNQEKSPQPLRPTRQTLLIGTCKLIQRDRDSPQVFRIIEGACPLLSQLGAGGAVQPEVVLPLGPPFAKLLLQLKQQFTFIFIISHFNLKWPLSAVSSKNDIKRTVLPGNGVTWQVYLKMAPYCRLTSKWHHTAGLPQNGTILQFHLKMPLYYSFIFKQHHTAASHPNGTILQLHLQTALYCSLISKWHYITVSSSNGIILQPHTQMALY